MRSFGYLWPGWCTPCVTRTCPTRSPGVVYTQVGCLLWLTAAITALSYHPVAAS